MKATTVRVSEETLDMLKLLKEGVGAKSITEVVKDMAHEALLKSYAFTVDGYLPPGTRVVDMEGKEHIIDKVVVRDSSLGNAVVFLDGSMALNGGGFVKKLRKVADKDVVMEERFDG